MLGGSVSLHISVLLLLLSTRSASARRGRFYDDASEFGGAAGYLARQPFHWRGFPPPDQEASGDTWESYDEDDRLPPSRWSNSARQQGNAWWPPRNYVRLPPVQDGGYNAFRRGPESRYLYGPPRSRRWGSEHIDYPDLSDFKVDTRAQTDDDDDDSGRDERSQQKDRWDRRRGREMGRGSRLSGNQRAYLQDQNKEDRSRRLQLDEKRPNSVREAAPDQPGPKRQEDNDGTPKPINVNLVISLDQKSAAMQSSLNRALLQTPSKPRQAARQSGPDIADTQPSKNIVINNYYHPAQPVSSVPLEEETIAPTAITTELSLTDEERQQLLQIQQQLQEQQQQQTQVQQQQLSQQQQPSQQQQQPLQQQAQQQQASVERAFAEDTTTVVVIEQATESSVHPALLLSTASTTMETVDPMAASDLETYLGTDLRDADDARPSGHAVHPHKMPGLVSDRSLLSSLHAQQHIAARKRRPSTIIASTSRAAGEATKSVEVLKSAESGKSSDVNRNVAVEAIRSMVDTVNTSGVNSAAHFKDLVKTREQAIASASVPTKRRCFSIVMEKDKTKRYKETPC